MATHSKYQFITLGAQHTHIDKIKDTFLSRVADLGIDTASVAFIDRDNFPEYKGNSPTACLYFGEVPATADLDELNILFADAAFIIPVVDSLANFNDAIPTVIRGINGFELNSETRIEALVGNVMEAMSLLRLSRRLFISYRRVESRSTAIQLYEHLDASGFDVFLDTHSIRPGEPFQEELWHRLVDTDIVVLLHTPGFLGSEWTREELAKASAMSIGILQLVWPNHTIDDMSSLCFPKYLETGDFVNGNYSTGDISLNKDVIKAITNDVESLRARSLAARQDNIIKEFMSAATMHGFTAILQPERFITVQKKSGEEISVIPTVGVPHAFTYNQSEELVKKIRESKSSAAYIIFDHRNIREKWQTHLAWLDVYLPVKAVKVTDLDKLFNSF